MSMKKILLGLALAGSVALPAAASAQYYGGGYGDYGYSYHHDGYRDYDRHEWRERARWERRREEARRRAYYAERYHRYHDYYGGY